MKRLDKGMDYGVIFGGSNGACFEQDGVLFDAAGCELGAERNDSQMSLFSQPINPVIDKPAASPQLIRRDISGEAFAMHEEGKTVEEIAGAMNIPAGKVKAILKRATR